MKENYKLFINKLDNELKDDCVMFIMNLLEQGKSTKEVYEEFLIPALAKYECDSKIEEICIWKECFSFLSST